MTNVLERAIDCNDADDAAEMIRRLCRHHSAAAGNLFVECASIYDRQGACRGSGKLH
jgi:hypothetical protein